MAPYHLQPHKSNESFMQNFSVINVISAKPEKEKNRIDPVTLNRAALNWDFFKSFAAAIQQVFINCDHTDIKIKKKTAPQPSYLLILSMFSAKIYNASNTTAPTPPPPHKTATLLRYVAVVV